MSKPSIPKGTRDLSPTETIKRNYIFSTIRNVYERYGFMPIETPAMENLSTLTGKYGDEGDQLIFKILNSGDYLAKTDANFLATKDSKKVLSQISEKALRYDLTVPTARYVVMHQNDITFPFKRYQIQPVWRADRPQKGRYREFYQCDADVIGSNSLVNEVEFIKIFDDVFAQLGVQVTVKLNNRKILSGIAEVLNEADKLIDITVAIDKLDKIGEEGVLKELAEKQISNETLEKLKPLIRFEGDTLAKLNFLQTYLQASAVGLKGIEEIKYILNLLSKFEFKSSQVELDLTLARGLNYYTGAIFEVKVNDKRTEFRSSICGGGRYDDLTGIFGLPNVSGVGISFGADRIYDVMEELNLFPPYTRVTTQLLFVNFGEAEQVYCLELADKLREADINCEVYPDSVKMKKQMGYADDKKIPFVALIGSDEMNSKMLTIKNMLTGIQQKWSLVKTINEILLYNQEYHA